MEPARKQSSSADITICMCMSETLPVYLSYVKCLGLLDASNSIPAQDLGVNEAGLRKLTGVAWSIGM